MKTRGLVIGRAIGRSVVIAVPPSDKTTYLVVQVSEIFAKKVHMKFRAPRAVVILRRELLQQVYPTPPEIEDILAEMDQQVFTGSRNEQSKGSSEHPAGDAE